MKISVELLSISGAAKRDGAVSLEHSFITLLWRYSKA